MIATEPEIGLVLADFAMPEMNGVELTQAVRHPGWPPEIVLSKCWGCSCSPAAMRSFELADPGANANGG